MQVFSSLLYILILHAEHNLSIFSLISQELFS